MNLDKVKTFYILYKELKVYVYEHADKVWDIYAQAIVNAHLDYGEKTFVRKYDFEDLDFDADYELPRLKYEYYSYGESDYEYLPIEWLFDENLYITVYNETVIKVQERLRVREENRLAKEQKDREHELKLLQSLKQKYPEV